MKRRKTLIATSLKGSVRKAMRWDFGRPLIPIAI